MYRDATKAIGPDNGLWKAEIFRELRAYGLHTCGDWRRISPKGFENDDYWRRVRTVRQGIVIAGRGCVPTVVFIGAIRVMTPGSSVPEPRRLHPLFTLSTSMTTTQHLKIARASPNRPSRIGPPPQSGPSGPQRQFYLRLSNPQNCDVPAANRGFTMARTDKYLSCAKCELMLETVSAANQYRRRVPASNPVAFPRLDPYLRHDP